MDGPQETKQGSILKQVSPETKFATSVITFLILHTHHFLTIKKHPKWSVSKQQDLKPMTPSNPAYQGLPVLGRWSTRDIFLPGELCLLEGRRTVGLFRVARLAGNGSLNIILNSTNPCPARHLPLGADTVSDKGADAEGGGAEFTVAAPGGNSLSCFLHLNFFR